MKTIFSMLFVLTLIALPLQSFAEEVSSEYHVGTIQWLQATYPSSGPAVIRVIDPDMNLNPEKIDNFDIFVWSDSNTKGYSPTATETDASTGVFEATLFFSLNDESSGPRLKVEEGDTVTAEYEDRTLPASYTEDSLSIIAKSEIRPIPESPLKQFKSGISVDETQCKTSLVLVTKHDGSPACVKPETKEKLEQRGWTHPCPNAMFSEQRSLCITGSPGIGSELKPELQAISKNNILSKGTGFDLPEDTFTQEDLEKLQQRENELRKIRDNPDTPYGQRQSVSGEIRQMQDRLQYPFQTGVPYHLVKEIKERYAVLEANLDDARKHVRFSVLNSDAISSEHHALRIGIHPQSFGMSELEIQDKKIRKYLGNEMNILYEAVSVIPN